MMKGIILRKAAAVTAAAVLGISSLSSVVMADSFAETGKEAIETKGPDAAKAWDEAVKDYQAQLTDSASAKGELYASLGAGAKQLLSMYAGMDLSWADSIDLIMAASTKAMDAMYAEYELYLNEKYICRMNMYMDMAAMKAYISIPELTDSWLAVDVQETMNQNGGYGVNYAEAVPAVEQLISALPSGEELQQMMERYSYIVLENAKEVEPETTTVTAADISQEVTSYGGYYGVPEMGAMLKALMAEARQDETLKKVIDAVSSLVPATEGGEDPYTQMLSYFDELESNIDSTDMSTVPEDQGVSVTYFEDADGNLVGMTYSVNVDGNPMGYSVISTTDGEQRGILIEGLRNDLYAAVEGPIVYDEEGAFESGSLTVTYGDLTVGEIDLYKSESEEGTTFLCADWTVIPQEIEEAEDGQDPAEADPLYMIKQYINLASQFGLTTAIDENSTRDNYDVIVIPKMNDQELGTIEYYAETGEGGEEMPDPASFEKVIDVSALSDGSEESQVVLNDFMVDIVNHMDGFAKTLEEAGVPETLISTLLQSFGLSTSSSADAGAAPAAEAAG